MTVSLNVVVLDEAARIGGLLEHVRPFVDELVVVDQGSSDGTAEIAAGLGARVVGDRRHGFGDPSRPLAEASSSGDWVLCLDADERCSPGFLERLGELTAGSVDGWVLERENWFGGQWWSSDWHLRLWRRGCVAWPVFDRPHRHWSVSGAVDRVAGALVHAKSWAEQLADDECYERLGAGAGPFLRLARLRGVSGAEVDALGVEGARRLGFDCSRGLPVV